MIHISHAATKTPPRNIAKQYAPYCTISFVVFRCVMPNTTDAQSANNSAAEKCESSIPYFFFPMAMWYASTAHTMFSRPATMMYFVP